MRKLIPWVGGKASLARHIVPLIPSHTCYVEVFAGGGGVFCAKPRSQVEVLNDRNAGLVMLFRVWQRHPEAFLKELGLVLSSRRFYEDCWTQPGLTDVERAARFWYRIRLTFCNKPAERSFGYSTVRGGHTAACDPEAVRQSILEVHGRLAGVILEDLPWEDVLRRYDRPHTCFYLDPPYYEVGKLYGPGLDFTREDHARLADRLKDVAGPFLLSLNDHPDVRSLYQWAWWRQFKVRYALGTNTTATARRRKASPELLIANRPWADGCRSGHQPAAGGC